MKIKMLLSLLAVISLSLPAHAAMYDDSNEESDETMQGTTRGMEEQSLVSPSTDSASAPSRSSGATDADESEEIADESAKIADESESSAPVVESVTPRPLAPEATRSVGSTAEQSNGAAPARATSTPEQASRIQENESPAVAELRGPSPKVLDPNRRGYFQLGIGPAYGAGLQSDSAMYNIVGSYNFNLSDVWTAKAIGDISLATGSVSSSIYNFAVGAEYYLNDIEFLGATPYLAADAGLAFARNAREETVTGAAVGGGAGFKFQAAQLNFDVNAHYVQLTAQAGDAAPSIFAVRGSVMF